MKTKVRLQDEILLEKLSGLESRIAATLARTMPRSDLPARLRRLPLMGSRKARLPALIVLNLLSGKIRRNTVSKELTSYLQELLVLHANLRKEVMHLRTELEELRSEDGQ